MRDLITVTDLSLRCSALQVDHWQRASKEQPLLCTLSIRTDVDAEAEHDNLLQDSFNYGTVTKSIETYIADLNEKEEEELSLEFVAEEIAKVVLFQANAPNVELELRRPRALLTADCIGVAITRSRSDYSQLPSSSAKSSSLDDYVLLPTAETTKEDKFFIRGLRRYIIIGLNPCERIDEQEVICDFDFYAAEGYEMINRARSGWSGWRGMVKQLESHLSTSQPLTIELITTSLARIITTPPPPPSPSSSSSPPTWNVPRTTVRVAKPVALMFAKHPSVQVTRSRSDFYPPLVGTRSLSTSTSGSSREHSAFIGLGTNLGDRVGNLMNALKELREIGKEDVKVVDTSFLYESEAMYHQDQDRFLNAAIEIKMNLSPPALLEVLKQVEKRLGRDFTTFRNGPRVVDLDLLLYDDLVFERTREESEKDDRWLKVPHQSIQEREFVLRPLVDIAPKRLHPSTSLTLTRHLELLLSSTPSTVHRVFPLSPESVFPFTRPSSLPCASTRTKTLLMSIINTTPDSFSDGGLNSSLETAIETSERHLELGSDILDIGGMSTRPGADDVSEEEEISRVVPLIESLRRDHNVKTPISIDTFRPSVAEAAIEAGANIINDVHGGKEVGMLSTMSTLGVPVVLMHSRGDSKTMTSLTEYGSEGVVAGVRREMEEMVRTALEAGIARWNILLDPGIGFAKTSEQNFTLLRNLDKLFGESELLREFPVLVGLSRKKFLGPDKEARERVLETTVGVTACVASGRCEVARVHDTKEVGDAVRVADGIYRS
ncbi:trifunctional dihydropteroate synthetase/dihydrohydroxymethylpterin pyrophosphokinase/dihydroneopterin aldolase FOL1 [Sporobolomyces salmoneus]|uniref:trifunctional dihydropteroate synthetase/dihydrohydroxymethylpterin pyrophosphokinase/dihydroneopterin aldolase FOL1 n=1 Tax=Sporobolomyces salmoneus TaxID=183962 RepID=UPI00317D7CF4